MEKLALSLQDLVESGGPSSSQRCLSDRLRYEQLLWDHQVGMRGRVESHYQQSSEKKSHVS